MGSEPQRGASQVACVLSFQSCPAICDPVACSPHGSFVHKILQARIREWVFFPSPGDLSDPRIKPESLISLHWQAGPLH